MRKRTLPPKEVLGSMHRCWYDGNGLINNEQNVSYVSSLRTQTFEDMEIENFHARSARGEIFCNPMKKVVVETSHSPWNLHTRYGLMGFTGENGVSMNVNTASEVFLDVADIAVKKAHAGASGAVADSLASILEAKETAVTLQSVAIRARKYLRKEGFRRFVKDLKRIRYWDDALLDQYLELRYGFRPMFYEAKGIKDAFNAKLTDRVTSRGFSSCSSRNVQTFSGGYYPGRSGRSGHEWTVSQVDTRKVSARAGVLSQVDPFFSDLAVWGFNDPMSSIWQATRLSFMIDWVLNIGDTISALTPDVGVSKLASWVVITEELKSTAKVTGVVPLYSGDVASGGGGNRVETITTTTRVPTPGFSLIPDVNIRLTPLKLVDSYAILRSIWTKDAKRVRRFERRHYHAT